MSGGFGARAALRRVGRWAAAVVFLAALAACTLLGDDAARTPRGTVSILAVNDVYRIEGVDRGRRAGLARLRALRASLEADHPGLLLLHGGDAIFPSLASRLYKGAQMIDALNRLDGDAAAFDPRLFATFGNHEFDDDDPAVIVGAVGGSRFTWLSANVAIVPEPENPAFWAANLHPSALVAANGVKVGLFGLTIDTGSPDYVAIAEPVETARRMSSALRAAGAELVVAVTHLRLGTDERILRELGPEGPDLIIGGHEHSAQAREVDGRWVLKTDADAVAPLLVQVTPRADGPPLLQRRAIVLDDSAAPPDPALQARVDEWMARHDRDYCATRDMAVGCLRDTVGWTAVTLIGAENLVRGNETNLGNWIADTAREAFAAHGAEIAFIGAGGLRLNENIPPGPIWRGDVENLIQFDDTLVLAEIGGAALRRLVERAFRRRPGSGSWLQISGLAIRQTESGPALYLLTPDGPEEITDDQTIRAVTTDYLAKRGNRDRDGRVKSLDRVPDAPEPDFKAVLYEALAGAAAADPPIAPRVEGRACVDPDGAAPCLAPARAAGRVPVN